MRTFSLALALVGLMAACAPNAGSVGVPLHADTFAPSGVLSGSVTTEAHCAATPDSAVWVLVEGRGECVRYFAAGLEKANRIAHFWFHGDRMIQWLDGRAKASSGYGCQADPSRLSEEAAKRFAADGVPFIRVSRPGVFGSSGHHKDRRLRRESLIVNAAIDALKAKYDISRVAISGQSGGGHVVASLLALRADIECAAATSGVVAVRKRSFIRGWNGRDITGHYDFYDPIQHVADIAPDTDRAIFIVAAPNDSNVPFSTQKAYFDELKDAGLQAWLIKAPGQGASSHGLAHVGYEVISACANGATHEAIAARYAG